MCLQSCILTILNAPKKNIEFNIFFIIYTTLFTTNFTIVKVIDCEWWTQVKHMNPSYFFFSTT